LLIAAGHFNFEAIERHLFEFLNGKKKTNKSSKWVARLENTSSISVNNTKDFVKDVCLRVAEKRTPGRCLTRYN